MAEVDLVRAVHYRGRAVADPQETAVALLQALRAKRHGTMAAARSGACGAGTRTSSPGG